MPIKSITRIALMTAFILLIPLLGKWPWTLVDFIIMGLLIFGTGLMYKFITNKANSTLYRIATGIAIATGFLLTWVNLAVGLIGNENNPANLMYFGVIAIGFIGAAIARFQSHGMARALFVTALAQALVPLIAFIIWKPSLNAGLIQVLGANTFFVALWIISARIFRQASIKESK